MSSQIITSIPIPLALLFEISFKSSKCPFKVSFEKFETGRIIRKLVGCLEMEQNVE